MDSKEVIGSSSAILDRIVNWDITPDEILEISPEDLEGIEMLLIHDMQQLLEYNRQVDPVLDMELRDYKWDYSLYEKNVKSKVFFWKLLTAATSKTLRSLTDSSYSASVSAVGITGRWELAAKFSLDAYEARLNRGDIYTDPEGLKLAKELIDILRATQSNLKISFVTEE